jgi:hypothetical protein
LSLVVLIFVASVVTDIGTGVTIALAPAARTDSAFVRCARVPPALV